MLDNMEYIFMKPLLILFKVWRSVSEILYNRPTKIMLFKTLSLRTVLLKHLKEDIEETTHIIDDYYSLFFINKLKLS